MASLLPGTLPCGADESGALIIHCLDVDEPLAEQYAADEAVLAAFASVGFVKDAYASRSSAPGDGDRR